MATDNLLDGKCRLDKWLWAARFYKTRSLATDAIDGGKIHVDGDRVKPAKEVRVGQVIHIRRKELDMEVVVKALSVTRRGAPEAALLYDETPESLAKRDNAAVTKEADHAKRERGAGRPTKRQLRDIKKFTGISHF
ncbi:RNA-binding S4 domain-containing protein [Candidatus Methylopumilus turicensis]|uniref:Heat shock protein 15 n=1 Tax=Candidatus Methylopumilus turicensis TaxID=1581680 RepID=A0A0B7IUS2_9PROT|nr:S4 domain-containing protein [Candidatus Methylopumilus turicensis]CEN56015.1 Heat shock protein 15 [Candidatus Methylopumilus turicensis]